MKHFKNPVSMRVTHEQFETDLRKPLEELGGKIIRDYGFKLFPILVSNSIAKNGMLENLSDSDKLNFNRHFIETYDPEQFIAICKLEVEMIVGECYTVVHCDGEKMTGYLLKNNVGNNKDYLRGYFKGVGFLGYYFEKAKICYSFNDRTIRLSTPEEKAKLDKVITENETPVNEVSLNPDGGYQEIEVKEEIVVKIPHGIKKLKKELKQAKKKVKLLTEVLKYLENEI